MCYFHNQREKYNDPYQKDKRSNFLDFCFSLFYQKVKNPNSFLNTLTFNSLGRLYFKYMSFKPKYSSSSLINWKSSFQIAKGTHPLCKMKAFHSLFSKILATTEASFLAHQRGVVSPSSHVAQPHKAVSAGSSSLFIFLPMHYWL